MALLSGQDIDARISNGYEWPISFAQSGNQAARTGIIAVSSHSTILTRCVPLSDTPSFPSGVTGYIPLEFALSASAVVSNSVLLTELILLGSIDLSTGTFTDGAAMPTRTVFNTSTQLASPVLAMFTATGGGTSRTLTLTYVDQDGNTAESTSALSIQNSASNDAGGTFPLKAGDWGVRDITNCTSAGTTPSGTVSFYGMVPIVLAQPTTGTVNNTVTDLIGNGIVRRLGAAAKWGAFTVGSAGQNGVVGYIKVVGDS